MAVRILKSIGLTALTVYAFYAFRLQALFPFMLILTVSIIQEWREEKRRREVRVREEFGEAMTKMSALLQSGHPLEHTFEDTARYLDQIYGRNSLLRGEISVIHSKLEMNVPVEVALKEFADHYHIREIDDFVDMILFVKRGSGNVGMVLADTMKLLSDNQKAEMEIQTLVYSKELEFQIMCLMPLVMLLMLRFSAYSFVASLYETEGGTLFMTGCMILYYVLRVVGRFITRIEV